MSSQWKHYNHALILICEPHQKCMPPKNKHTFWRIGRGKHFSQDGQQILIVTMKLTGDMLLKTRHLI